jgi:hypothetical protein
MEPRELLHQDHNVLEALVAEVLHLVTAVEAEPQAAEDILAAAEEITQEILLVAEEEVILQMV